MPVHVFKDTDDIEVTGRKRFDIEVNKKIYSISPIECNGRELIICMAVEIGPDNWVRFRTDRIPGLDRKKYSMSMWAKNKGLIVAKYLNDQNLSDLEIIMSCMEKPHKI